MPTYTFRNILTGDEFEKFMSISAREDYLKENLNLESLIVSTPPIIDPVRLGIRKTDQGFKEVLQRIHEKNGGGKGRSGSMLGKTTRQL